MMKTKIKAGQPVYVFESPTLRAADVYGEKALWIETYQGKCLVIDSRGYLAYYPYECLRVIEEATEVVETPKFGE